MPLIYIYQNLTRKSDCNIFKRQLIASILKLKFNYIDKTIKHINKRILTIAEQCFSIAGDKFSQRPVLCWGPEMKQILDRKISLQVIQLNQITSR